jgi:hypothetical protein
MPILALVAALRIIKPGNSSAAEYAVFALLASAVGLIVLCFMKTKTTRTSRPDHR